MPSISVGRPDESPLVEAIRWEGLEMPPKENDRLNKKQIADIEKWIRDGAAWPNIETIDKIRQSSWSEIQQQRW